MLTGGFRCPNCGNTQEFFLPSNACQSFADVLCKPPCLTIFEIKTILCYLAMAARSVLGGPLKHLILNTMAGRAEEMSRHCDANSTHGSIQDFDLQNHLKGMDLTLFVGVISHRYRQGFNVRCFNLGLMESNGTSSASSARGGQRESSAFLRSNVTPTWRDGSSSAACTEIHLLDSHFRYQSQVKFDPNLTNLER